jgi:hypothetical protein
MNEPITNHQPPATKMIQTKLSPGAMRGAPNLQTPPRESGEKKLRDTFDAFVGQTFYGQMLKALRETQGKPAYFHGGRGEEAFQAQLDQMLSEKMAKASAHQFTGPMFEQFQLELSQMQRM